MTQYPIVSEKSPLLYSPVHVKQKQKILEKHQYVVDVPFSKLL